MNNDIKYGGFWIRLAASMVDSILALAIILPILTLVYGPEYFTSPAPIRGPIDLILTWIFPFLAIVIFWKCKSATPGKMLFNLIIVDAKTLQKPTTAQLIIRYFSYYVSTIPFCLGFLWIAFDSRKQGWHDKIAGTLVIKEQEHV
jgi:uncharacterized RDD family membrane protein YckC